MATRRFTGGRTSHAEAFDVEVEFGSLCLQLLEEARGNPLLFRSASTAAILEAQAYVQNVLWAHTPVGTGASRTLLGFDPPNPYDREPMGYLGWNSPASRYLIFPELGTRAFRAPLGALMVWAGRKFGNVTMAFRAYGAISRKGIKKQAFVLAAADEAQPLAGQIMLNRIWKTINDWGK